MQPMFRDPLHEQLAGWLLAYIPYGAADLGEIARIGETVGDGGDDAFHDAWVAAADELMAQGETAQSRGHLVSARECFLKASAFYGKAYHPLFGEPVDPRVPAASRRQIAAFGRGLALDDTPALPLRIPFEGARLPGWLIPARGGASRRGPLLIVTNGYDASITDPYFASVVAASRRGYHCLIFDGPGQGAALIEQGLRMRADWEVVIRAVVDFALTLPGVDPDRIALSGWSLGGYLAPRAATAEHRLAACIADPGQLSVAGNVRGFALKMGATEAEAANAAEAPQAVLDRMEAAIRADRKLRWSIVQRGFWVHGVSNLRDYLRVLQPFTIEDRIGDIRCPTLLTMAEDDPLAARTQAMFDALRCRKSLVPMLRSEGAGDHCSMGNRSLLNRRVLDWLDEVMGAERPV